MKGSKTTLQAGGAGTFLESGAGDSTDPADQEQYGTLESAEKHIKETIQKQINKKRRINKQKNASTNPVDLYAHRLRNYAQVCDSGISFQGVVGVENADKDEIAALTLLLDTSLGDHAYKVGLNKAMGMGAVSSSINEIWIRKPETYKWKRHPVRSDKRDAKDEKAVQKNIKQLLKDEIGVDRELAILTDVSRMIQQQLKLKENEVPDYPDAGPRYWSGDPAPVIDVHSFRETAKAAKEDSR